MYKIKTKTGFECEISEDVFDDIELVEFFNEFDEGKPQNFGKAVRKVLGKDAARLYDHVRTDDGRVPYAPIAEEVMSISEEIEKQRAENK